MTNRPLIAAAALLLSATPALAAAREAQCIPAPEAEALTITIAPDLLEAVGRRCAVTLPEGAALRAGLPAIVARFRAEAPAAAAGTQAAITRIAGNELRGADAAATVTVMTGVLATQAAESVKIKDCGTLDRAAGLIADVPPRALAGLLVLFAELGADRKGGFSICPTPAR